MTVVEEGANVTVEGATAADLDRTHDAVRQIQRTLTEQQELVQALERTVARLTERVSELEQEVRQWRPDQEWWR